MWIIVLVLGELWQRGTCASVLVSNGESRSGQIVLLPQPGAPAQGGLSPERLPSMANYPVGTGTQAPQSQQSQQSQRNQCNPQHFMSFFFFIFKFSLILIF